MWELHIKARFLDTAYSDTDKKHKNIQILEWVNPLAAQNNITFIFSNKFTV